MRGVYAVIAAVLVGAALVAGYALAGGGDYQPTAVSDPCAERPVPRDAPLADRLVGTALDGTACELGIPREDLVLALAGAEDFGDIERREGLRRGSLEPAMREGLHRAVDRAQDDGAIGSIEAFAIDTAIDAVPLESLLRALRQIAGV